MIAAFERMEEQPNQTSDDCFDWFNGVRDGWFKPVVDTNCEIFQVTHEDCVVMPSDGRLHNTYTDSRPCVYHMAGGYTSQTEGKDDRMIPWAKKLGII